MTNGAATVLTDSSGYTRTVADAKFATLTGTEVLTNKTVEDTYFSIVSFVDHTKKAVFEAALISPNTIRIYSLPNVDGTLITAGDTGTVSNAMLATISTAGEVTNAATAAFLGGHYQCGTERQRLNRHNVANRKDYQRCVL